MTNILRTVFATALLTACGAPGASHVQAANPGAAHLSGSEAAAFAAALIDSGVVRSGADLGAFVVQADAVSCAVSPATSGNLACTIETASGLLTAPSAAADTLFSTLNQHGAMTGGAHSGQVAAVAHGVKCVAAASGSTSCTILSLN